MTVARSATPSLARTASHLLDCVTEMGGAMETQGVLRDGDRYELLGELASGGMATVYVGCALGVHDPRHLVAI